MIIKTFHFCLLFIGCAALLVTSQEPAYAQGLSGTGTADQCRDNVIKIDRELSVAQELQTELETLLDEVSVRIAPFTNCQNQTMLYVPGHPEADGSGCVNPQELVGPQGPAGPPGPNGRSVLCYH